MVVNRRTLPRSPDKADDGEPLPGIAVEQVLAIGVGVRLGEFGREPVVDRDEGSQCSAAALDDRGLVRADIHERGQLADKAAQALDPVSHDPSPHKGATKKRQV
jgi:hypothetical protein